MRKLQILPKNRTAETILLWTLRLACGMVFISWLLLLSGPLEPRTYELYRLSGQLQTDSAAVLLLGNILALLCEGLELR